MGRYDELSGIVSPNIACTCERVGQHPEHPVTVVSLNAGQRREQAHNRVRPPCQQAYEHLVVGLTFLLTSTHYKDSVRLPAFRDQLATPAVSDGSRATERPDRWC